MAISMHFEMMVVYQDELAPLNQSYEHPMQFHGETYQDAFHAYMAWNDCRL